VIAEPLGDKRLFYFFRRWALALGALVWLTPFSWAQNEWPTKSVRLVVPYVPGGGADTLGRLASNHLSKVFKQPFVIDNRAGAGGVIGSQAVIKLAPDGYNLVVSGIGSHVIAPATLSNVYDPLKDFTHIALLGGPPLVLVVNAELPIKDVKGFVQYVGTQANGLSWGSPGLGTHGHLIGELLAQTAKINLVHVNYRGGAGAMGDLMGNQIPAAIVTFSSASSHIKSGRIRALAVTSAKRLSAYPEIPTFAESGYPNLNATTWFSLSGPAGMPKDLVDKINAEVRRGLQAPSVQAQLAFEGIETGTLDATAFLAFFKTEIDRWTPLVRSVEKNKL
jgi:tripartite-type tricarboxylate transporter receptor subunit TctC